MTHDELKHKVLCESSARPRGMGPYAVYSFLMKFISDTEKAVRFMKKEGYSGTEISQAIWNRTRDLKNQKNRVML